MNKDRFYKWFRDYVYFTEGAITGTFEDYASNAYVKYMIAKSIRPTSIVEIGVKTGFSALSLCKGAGLDIKRFVGIDNYDPDYFGAKNAEIHKARAQKLFGDRLFIQDSQSQPFPPADFYHIDANHTEDAVYNDIRKAFRTANFGATVLLDDCKVSDSGVYRAAMRFEKEGGSVLLVPSWRGEAILTQ